MSDVVEGSLGEVEEVAGVGEGPCAGVEVERAGLGEFVADGKVSAVEVVGSVAGYGEVSEGEVSPD